MESKDELKEIDMKNCTYYFDDIMRVIHRNTDFSEILLEEKWHKNTKSTLIYDISYKTSTGAKPLRVMLV